MVDILFDILFVLIVGVGLIGFVVVMSFVWVYVLVCIIDCFVVFVLFLCVIGI